MKKAAVYFPLASNDATTIKSADLIMNYGYNGYGIYITLIQRLVSTPERRIELDKIKALAFDMHTTVAELQPIITNYFDTDSTFFYSLELNDRMIFFDDKYNRASEGGKKAANNLSDEQRKERAQKAATTRWNKEETKDNTNPMLTSKHNMLSSKQEILTPLAVDANNKIKENRIEEKKKEENEPTVRVASQPEKIESKVLNKNDIPTMSQNEIDIVLNKYKLSSYTNEAITKKFIDYCTQYTSIDYGNYFDYFIAITSSVIAQQTPIENINRDKIKHQISINEIDLNTTIYQLSTNQDELNKLKRLANYVADKIK